jgi:hypothetical protein
VFATFAAIPYTFRKRHCRSAIFRDWAMNVIHSDQRIEWKGARSIFLAGPTPRASHVPSWRPDALRILEELRFDGDVLVPERRSWDVRFNYEDQVEWEYAGLQGCSCIAFWVPRRLDTLPGLTTNVEFGFYVCSGRALYGRPDDAEKCHYLDWLYEKVTGQKPLKDLRELLNAAAGR